MPTAQQRVYSNLRLFALHSSAASINNRPKKTMFEAENRNRLVRGGQFSAHNIVQRRKQLTTYESNPTDMKCVTFFPETDSVDMKSSSAINLCKYVVERIPAHVLRWGAVSLCLLVWVLFFKLLF